MINFKKINNATVMNIIQNGGATFNRKMEKVIFKQGYQVSKKDLYIINIDLNNINKIVQAIRHAIFCSLNGEYIGCWVNDNKMYIDLSIKINNKTKALAFGKKLKQLTIYEWKTGKCLEC